MKTFSATEIREILETITDDIVCSIDEIDDFPVDDDCQIIICTGLYKWNDGTIRSQKEKF